MGPLTEKLCTVLTELEELLAASGEVHWRQWIARDLQGIRSGDIGGVDHFLSACGGMGSLNDLVLHPSNGHRLALADVGAVNTELRALLSVAWELAREVRRAAVIDDDPGSVER